MMMMMMMMRMMKLFSGPAFCMDALRSLDAARQPAKVMMLIILSMKVMRKALLMLLMMMMMMLMLVQPNLSHIPVVCLT